jgi:hypothetical protein
MAALMSAILAGLEFLVYRSLAAVERGEPGAAIWAPIAIVYELWGFGAALSVLPLLWLVLMGIVAVQTWARIKAEQSAGEESSQ